MNTDYSPEDIREIIKVVDPYLTLVDEILDKAAPVLDKIFSRLSSYMREQNVKTIKYYESEGFTRAEALLLTINTSTSLVKALENTGKGKK